MGSVIKLKVRKLIDQVLGTPSYDNTKFWETRGSFELPHERWNREQEEVLRLVDRQNNGVLLSPKNGEEFDRIITFLDCQGFRPGSVVCKSDDKLHHRMDPINWGIITNMMRYKPEFLSAYKPMKVAWILGIPEMAYFDEQELFIIMPAPTKSFLLERFRKEQQRRGCI